MSKRTKSIISLVLSLVLLAGLCFVSAVGIGEEHKGSAKNIILGLDLRGGVSITYEAKGGTPSVTDMNDTIKKLQKRAEIYSTEADVYQEGDNRIVVNIPGQSDAEKVKEELGKPGALSLVTGYGTKDEKVWIEGSDIASAEAGAINKNGIEYGVSIKMTSEATKKFEEATRSNLNKTLSIIYDGKEISSPKVNEVITSGECWISGMANMEEGEELASVLRIGSLKIELEDISSSVIGPKLGERAIESSLLAGIIGLIIIIIFMIIVYRIPGVAAGIALVFYVVLDLVTLNIFDITLTLPGLAGIILAIGMAVDANVIIYARIKEEITAGNTVELAIKTGFKKATSAIVDGNVTTFIAAVVLMIAGSGTIKGFALTLAIGIVLSMASAMIISRVMLMVLYNLGFDSEKFYGRQKERKTVDFLKRKTICFIISGVIIVAGFVTMVVSSFTGRDKMLNFSVEFEGGKSMTVEFNKSYSIEDFNNTIKPEIVKIAGDSDITGSAVDGSNSFNIKLKELSDEKNTELKNMLVTKFGAVKESFEETNISATVGKEMRKDALIAVIISTVCMLIYIFIRFRDIRFASSAVLALIHDILIVLAFYAIAWTSVGNTFIACMLTILGYSINATIVIFDRIRENIAQGGKKLDIKEVINASITQTLTRSIYTTFTTFIMVFMLALLGVSAMRDFAIPLIVGILAGGYSSIFLTGAMWYLMARKKYATGNYIKKKVEIDERNY
ncbi:MAG: protein translocase subunit SecD [Lachnospiraceae bacterium]|nr:protein translocase subunit SecD [Lachnospiraceae bacterium]